MHDKYGRAIKSFRISVTPECNLKCFYCHREGHGCGKDTLMKPDELGKIVHSALDFGVKKIKISGGEPLLRTDIVEIVENIVHEQIIDISMTTNGILLEKYAEGLKKAGLDRVNVSLDTLDPEQYKEITGGNVDKVLKGIEKAIEVGLTPLKVNYLAMKCNLDQLPKIMDYCSKVGAILQVIEFIPMEEELKEQHVDVNKIEEEISKDAVDVVTRKFMQNRKKYVLKNGLEVEFVKPMDNTEFCGHCTRIRLTYDGQLKACLLRDDNLVDVLTPIRNGEKDIKKYFVECIDNREPFCK
ncbi:GTP 3',8-cyclase MoaA [Methanococcus voltae]|uniref:Probable GTP 3',8-cyclase n=2 Tax=Methanococcus voltae TaxID=2188 RepID=A0A8J7UUJ7_METVO|nr:GTP 3',8-cyclase MoaA [Methanococcus voltae]MBP2172677.1 cyclic pyranopterin phosphate synthase [Methanococcus voltae]MBP2201406.1 cyclic pyranopterin phosphate synthase [Methanococcus voltae]MCS3922201.1 cyclic pyranopterin phosphate synthase [Methanococcus voltae PS]